MKRLAPLFASVYLMSCATETIVIAYRERTQEDAGDADDADAGAESDADLLPESGAQDAESETDDAMADGGCRTADDCGDGNYCEKVQRTDRYGTCAERPKGACETARNPVCGSDNISYFNDCLRKQHGVAFATNNECPPNASPCGDLFTPSACPSGTVCGRLSKYPAPDDIALLCAFDVALMPGQCWVVPDCGDELVGGWRWVPCLPPPPPATFGGGGSPGGSPGSGAGGGSFGGGAGGNFGGSGMMCVDTCRAIQSEEVHVLVPPSACPR